MTTPTREQVVQWEAEAAKFKTGEYTETIDLVSFAAIARADLEAEIDNIKQVEFPRKVEAVAIGWRKKVVDLEATIADQEQSLQNLCARIHRNGGHYAAEHGLSKAILDADTVVANAFGTIAEQAAEIERLKTVPMKYRRMRFNAALQDENAALKAELDGEKAAALNYRTDAIKAEKQRDELLALLNKAESLIESLPVQVETLQGGYRLANAPAPIVHLLSEIKIAIASVKGDPK